MWRFADGVAFDIDKEDAPDIAWPDWHLKDDVGTAYEDRGAGGSDDSEQISFRAPIPATATWIELSLAQRAGVSFRVRL